LRQLRVQAGAPRNQGVVHPLSVFVLEVLAIFGFNKSWNLRDYHGANVLLRIRGRADIGRFWVVEVLQNRFGGFREQFPLFRIISPG
jgi:hypothetical protein